MRICTLSPTRPAGIHKKSHNFPPPPLKISHANILLRDPPARYSLHLMIFNGFLRFGIRLRELKNLYPRFGQQLVWSAILLYLLTTCNIIFGSICDSSYTYILKRKPKINRILVVFRVALLRKKAISLGGAVGRFARILTKYRLCPRCPI